MLSVTCFTWYTYLVDFCYIWIPPIFIFVYFTACLLKCQYPSIVEGFREPVYNCNLYVLKGCLIYSHNNDTTYTIPMLYPNKVWGIYMNSYVCQTGQTSTPFIRSTLNFVNMFTFNLTTSSIYSYTFLTELCHFEFLIFKYITQNDYVLYSS